MSPKAWGAILGALLHCLAERSSTRWPHAHSRGPSSCAPETGCLEGCVPARDPQPHRPALWGPWEGCSSPRGVLDIVGLLLSHKVTSSSKSSEWSSRPSPESWSVGMCGVCVQGPPWARGLWACVVCAGLATCTPQPRRPGCGLVTRFCWKGGRGLCDGVCLDGACSPSSTCVLLGWVWPWGFRDGFSCSSCRGAGPLRLPPCCAGLCVAHADLVFQMLCLQSSAWSLALEVATHCPVIVPVPTVRGSY